MKILALDVGRKRIGLAISQSGILVQEFLTMDNKESSSFTEIAEIIEDEGIEKLVIGLPKNMDGTDAEITKYVEEFSKKLSAIISIPVDFEDERLTTKEAERQLRNSGLNHEEIEKRIDQYSAKLILEQYLE